MPAKEKLSPDVVPDMWGIDPDEIFYWTPTVARTVIQEGVWNIKGMTWDKPYLYGAPVDGAPVFQIACLPEKTAVKLAAAKTRYVISQGRIMQRAATDKKADVDKLTDTLLEQAGTIYTPELISDVLKVAIVGWTNLKSRSGKILEYTGSWDKDIRKIPQPWRAELFKVIVDETLYKGKEDSFTSVPGSSKD